MLLVGAKTPENKDIWIGLFRCSPSSPEGIGEKPVVRIDKSDIIPCCGFQTGIPGGGYAPVRLPEDRRAGKGPTDHIGRTIRRAVIDHDGLNGYVDGRIQAGRNGFSRIEGRNDDAYSHTFLFSPI